MKKIFLMFIVALQVSAGIITLPIKAIDKDESTVTIEVDKIDVGMSGFIIHQIAPNHNSILKNIVVTAYDPVSKKATLFMSDYDALQNNALPKGEWEVKVGDSAILAFGYDRALLIAPSEEIFYRLTKSVKIQWIHPDIFATILSFRGHPTPQKEDFDVFTTAASVGLIFLYLDNKVYTLDAKSFMILNIAEAPLVQDNEVYPFYTRVEKIDQAWWGWFGGASSVMSDYAPHYYELLVEHNAKNKALYSIVKQQGEKLHHLLNDFDFEE
ncbi:MAG: plasminogen-binding N-terminal domain-containing protein [Sulfurimonas sp.]|nr:plasminogen-binding N-terminal domain-containing protein [Sulfurimonas sp.]